MNEIENFLNTVSSRVSMRPEERDRIKTHLYDLVQREKNISPHVPVSSPWVTGVSFFLRRHTMSVAFVAILFFTGTTSAIADKALPGDVLYPLKTQINEQVLGWFSVSQYDKAELSIKLAERRLLEAETIDDREVSLQVKENHRLLLEKQINEADTNALRLEKSEGNVVPSVSKKNTSESELTTSTEINPVATSFRASADFSQKIIAVPSQKDFIDRKEALRERFRDAQKNVLSIRKTKKMKERVVPIEAQLLKVQKIFLDVRKIKNDDLLTETSVAILDDVENSLAHIEESLVQLNRELDGPIPVIDKPKEKDRTGAVDVNPDIPTQSDGGVSRDIELKSEPVGE